MKILSKLVIMAELTTACFHLSRHMSVARERLLGNETVDAYERLIGTLTPLADKVGEVIVRVGTGTVPITATPSSVAPVERPRTRSLAAAEQATGESSEESTVSDTTAEDPPVQPLEFVTNVTQANELLRNCDLLVEKLKDRVVALKRVQVPQPNQVPSPSPTTPPVEKVHHVKLPEIRLPTFSGDMLKWDSFWRTFSEAVDERQDISIAAKYFYLEGCLRGEALEELQGLKDTKNSYPIAKERLARRYGNTEERAELWYIELRNLRTPQHKEADLTKFRKTYLNLLAEMEADNPNSTAHPHTRRLIYDKLSARTKRAIYHQYHTNRPSLEQITEGLHHEIEALRLCDDPRPKTNQPKTSMYQAQIKGQNWSGAKFQHPCKFCKQDHSHFRCSTHTTVKARRQQTNRFGLCFNCLSDKHKAPECPSD